GVLMDSDGAYPVTDSGSKKLEMYYGNFDKRRYEKKDVEYYLMVGNPEQIMDNVSDISGKAPMLPKWAMGFMNTEWGIDEAEMRDMVSQYRAKDIPIDSYAIDYDWKKWGEDNYGEFSWNTSNFPSVANGTLKSDMNGEGIQMVGIMKP
ncbi:Glycoside hydrolase family 31 like protein, partial [Aduncisulcus paluster]